MIVDPTALLEQVVDDVVSSAFRGAGQRCSALRLLCAQADIADPLIEILIGAMNTLGIHSRLHRRAHEIFAASRTGNTYVNRNIVGAVVGVQPFGGQGLSGTGPKAGGPPLPPTLRRRTRLHRQRNRLGRQRGVAARHQIDITY